MYLDILTQIIIKLYLPIISIKLILNCILNIIKLLWIKHISRYQRVICLLSTFATCKVQILLISNYQIDLYRIVFGKIILKQNAPILKKFI